MHKTMRTKMMTTILLLLLLLMMMLLMIMMTMMTMMMMTTTITMTMMMMMMMVSLTQSAVLSFMTETLEGATSFRAFKTEASAYAANFDKVDRFVASSLLFEGATAWQGIRVGVLRGVFVAGTMLAAVVGSTTGAVSPATCGLLLVYALGVAESLM